MSKSIKKCVSVVIMTALLLQTALWSTSGEVALAAKKPGLRKKKVTIEVGKTYTVAIKNKQKKAKYAYKSSNKKVVAVSKAGKVKGVKKGSAKITVQQKLKKKTTKVGVLKVTVRAKKSEQEASVAPTSTASTSNVPTATAPATKAPTTTAPATKAPATTAPATVKPSATVVPTTKPSATVAPTTEPPATYEPEYLEMLADSYMDDGANVNNVRLKNMIEKAKNGDAVNVACLGGSITQGFNAQPRSRSYANQFYEGFKKAYAKDGGENVKLVNAGINGTASSLGWIRYQRDVVDKLGGNPDIFIIEFAVNDGVNASDSNGDYTNGAAYESMVRDVMSLPNKPAVILLFSVFQSEFNLQDRYKAIGDKYGLPMVSIKDAVIPRIKDGSMTNADFFAADGLHPTNDGHQIMTDCLLYCVDAIDQATKDAEDVTIPDTTHFDEGGDYQNLVTIYSGSELPEGVTVDAGGFNVADNTNSFFPTNWSHGEASGDAPFVITATCKNMLLAFNGGSNSGSVDVYVDGELAKQIRTVGWSAGSSMPLFNEDTAESHTVEIRMAEGSETKKFPIYAIAYTK